MITVNNEGRPDPVARKVCHTKRNDIYHAQQTTGPRPGRKILSSFSK